MIFWNKLNFDVYVIIEQIWEFVINLSCNKKLAVVHLVKFTKVIKNNLYQQQNFLVFWFVYKYFFENNKFILKGINLKTNEEIAVKLEPSKTKFP